MVLLLLPGAPFALLAAIGNAQFQSAGSFFKCNPRKYLFHCFASEVESSHRRGCIDANTHLQRIAVFFFACGRNQQPRATTLRGSAPFGTRTHGWRGRVGCEDALLISLLVSCASPRPKVRDTAQSDKRLLRVGCAWLLGCTLNCSTMTTTSTSTTSTSSSSSPPPPFESCHIVESRWPAVSIPDVGLGEYMLQRLQHGSRAALKDAQSG